MDHKQYQQVSFWMAATFIVAGLALLHDGGPSMRSSPTADHAASNRSRVYRTRSQLPETVTRVSGASPTEQTAKRSLDDQLSAEAPQKIETTTEVLRVSAEVGEESQGDPVRPAVWLSHQIESL